MNERTVIQVIGPPGGGKTLLIERLLRANRARTIGALRVVDGKDAGATAAAARSEAGRFTAAGAAVSDRVVIPDATAGSVWGALEAGNDFLFACDVILIEGGPATAGDVDGIVFVAPPLADGEPLVFDETREVGRYDGRDALLLMLGIDPNSVEDDVPLDDDTELADVEEEVIDSIELSESQAGAITRLLEHGMPVVHSGHWLRAGWEGLAQAELAVVNARAGHGEAEALATLRALEALRKDERWHATLAPRRHDAGPRRSFLTDLADPRDGESRRLIDTIKRRWR